MVIEINIIKYYRQICFSGETVRPPLAVSLWGVKKEDR